MLFAVVALALVPVVAQRVQDGPELGVLTGRLSSSTADVVAGISLSARNLRGGQVRLAAVQRDGTFEFSEMEEGAYSLAVLTPGYYLEPVNTSCNGPTIVSLDRNDRIQSLDLRLARLSTVQGTIRLATGRLAAGYPISLVSAESDSELAASPQVTVSTNDIGQFKAYVKAGSYFIRAHPRAAIRGVRLEPHYDLETLFSTSLALPLGVTKQSLATISATSPQADKPTYFPGVEDSTQAARVVVPPSTTVSRVDFALLRTAVFEVDGRVIFKVTSVSSGGVISLVPIGETGMALSFQARVSSRGDFRVDGVPSGRYRLMFESGDSGWSASQELDVVGNTHVNVEPQSVSRIRGHLAWSDHGAGSLEGFEVRLGRALAIMSAKVQSTVTSSSGDFSFEQVAPGQYRLELNHSVLDKGFVIDSLDANGQRFGRTDFTILPGDNTSVQLQIRAIPLLVGFVVDDLRRPVAGCTVVGQLAGRSEEIGQPDLVGFTDISGRFILRPEKEGDYDLFVRSAVQSGGKSTASPASGATRATYTFSSSGKESVLLVIR